MLICSLFLCLKPDKPIKRTMRQIREMMTGLTIAKWHDGKQYVALDLKQLEK
jgi:hypothetical protein